MTQQDTAARTAIPAKKSHRWVPWVLAGVLALTCRRLVMDRVHVAPLPVFHRLTFSRGMIHGARYTPDGASVIYSARWEGGESDVYLARADVPGSRSLGFPGVELRGMSPKGELALLKTTSMGNFYAPTGTLAVAPYSGGALRDLDEKIAFVDWSATDEMAVVRLTDRGFQLEYPVGTVLYRTAGYVSEPRISPDGDQVAFLNHSAENNSGVVTVVNRKGNTRALSSRYAASGGLAWQPSGKEIWFTAAKQGARLELRAPK